MTAAAASETGKTAAAGGTRRPRFIPVPDHEPPLDPDWPPRTDKPWATPAASVTATVVPLWPLPAPAPAESDADDPAVRVHTWRATPAAVRAPSARAVSAKPAALARPPAPGPRAVPARAFQKITVKSDRTPGWSTDYDMGVTFTPTSELPEVGRASVTLARALMEALAGCRSLEQLRAHCSPEVFAGLEDAPMLGGRHTTQLISTHTCEPADGIAEVSAVFRCSGTVRAFALRLQGIDGRWRITALQIA